MTCTRRTFLQRGGLGLLAFHVGGCEVELTPQQARQQGATLRVLSSAEVRALEALGDVLLPGSSANGIAYYVDHQLAAPVGEQLLMIKYLSVEPPFTAFYRGGLAALESAARTAHQTGFTSLDFDRQREFVALMGRENPAGWEGGPPAPFFFFVVRNDALDVTYGTTEGFGKLDIPYRAHIAPPSRWGS